MNDDINVDKTGLIAYTNSHISKSGRFMCVTRPRRFGKSYAVDQIEGKGYNDYFEYRGYHGDVIHVGLDFKKMTAEKRLGLAKKNSSSGNESEDKTYSSGNDAGLDTKVEIVHFCEIRKCRI